MSLLDRLAGTEAPPLSPWVFFKSLHAAKWDYIETVEIRDSLRLTQSEVQDAQEMVQQLRDAGVAPEAAFNAFQAMREGRLTKEQVKALLGLKRG